MTKFQWSPLVQGIVNRNLPLLSHPEFIPLPKPSDDAAVTIPSLLAVHLRRGDFKEHCVNLASWYAPFNGWNQFPDLIDKLGDPWKMGSDEERKRIYLEHCLPTVDQVIAKLAEVKKRWDTGGAGDRRKLDRVYFLTNAELEYRDELRTKLTEAGWKHIAMTYEMQINQDEVEVDMAADMMIAQLAEVFVGNGVCPTTFLPVVPLTDPFAVL